MNQSHLKKKSLHQKVNQTSELREMSVEAFYLHIHFKIFYSVLQSRAIRFIVAIRGVQLYPQIKLSLAVVLTCQVQGAARTSQTHSSEILLLICFFDMLP